MIAATLAAAAALGAFAWSFTEYAMHHWNGHLGRGRTRFSREHLRHHADPTYFTPNRTKAILAAPGVTGLAVAGVLLAGPAPGLAFAAGFLAAYVGYEVLHRRIHVVPPRGPYSRWARRHHLSHHYASPKHNHGVTSPLWDLVFRTWRRPGVVRVPERLATGWLRDPATGDVPAAFGRDYVLARPGRR